MSEQPVLSIELLCLGLRETNRLKLFFDDFGDDRYAICMDSADAQIVIVDIDSAVARIDFSTYAEAHPDTPALFMSFNEPDFAGYAEFIKKPLQSDELTAVLARLYQQVYPHIPVAEQPVEQTAFNEHQASTMTIADGQAGADEESVFIDVFGDEEERPVITDSEKKICGDSHAVLGTDDEDLQLSIRGLLLEKLIRLIKSESGNQVISTSQWQKIYFLRERRKIVCNIDADVLHDLCSSEFPDNVVSDYAEDEIPAGVAEVDALAFLWQIALWTYRGRLPSEHELDKRVYIAQWPNFTRMIKPPNAMRITSVWLRYTPSLIDTARLLDIPQRHVFSLYSAAYTIGIAGICRRESDHLIEYNTLRTHANHIANQNILNSLG